MSTAARTMGPQARGCTRGVDTENQCDQSQGDGDGAGDVQTRALLVSCFLEDHGSDQDDRECHDDVDEEGPAPGDSARKDPAEDGAGGESCGHESAVEAERTRACGSLGEHRGHQGHRGGGDHGSGDALPNPRGQEGCRCCGEAAEKRRGAQEEDSKEEEPLAPEEIGDTAEEQRKTRGA